MKKFYISGLALPFLKIKSLGGIYLEKILYIRSGSSIFKNQVSWRHISWNSFENEMSLAWSFLKISFKWSRPFKNQDCSFLKSCGHKNSLIIIQYKKLYLSSSIYKCFWIDFWKWNGVKKKNNSFLHFITIFKSPKPE